MITQLFAQSVSVHPDWCPSSATLLSWGGFSWFPLITHDEVLCSDAIFLNIFFDFFFQFDDISTAKKFYLFKNFWNQLKMLSSPQHDQNQKGPPVCETWWKLFGKQCHTHKQSPRLVTGPATCTRWWWWLIVGNLWDFSLLVRVVLQYNTVVLVCPGGGLVA